MNKSRVNAIHLVLLTIELFFYHRVCNKSYLKGTFIFPMAREFIYQRM